MKRPLVYDITHVVSRLAITSPTGIDRVDLMFAKHFVGGEPALATVAHYGFRRPHVLDANQARSIVRMGRELWEPNDSKRNRLFSRGLDKSIASVTSIRGQIDKLLWKVPRLLKIQRLRLRDAPRTHIPKNSIYINVAQHLLEFPVFFKWLNARPDIAKVFFVHDLLPLDHPEFFPAGYHKRFEKRLRTILRHATALVVSTESVARRVEAELQTRGRSNIPIHIALLPSSIETSRQDQDAEIELPSAPYFVMVGTIEPRKNHLLLLHIWRELAKGPGPVPVLVIVGKPGWETEQVMDLLSRCTQIRPHILRLSGLSVFQLRKLLAHARALLMPSFAEGYGLPLVEALGVGTPVIASDTGVFREVSQNRALFLSPLDGLGWQAAIKDMTVDGSSLRAEFASRAAAFRAPSPVEYFDKFEAFLSSL
ncbi:MAG: glycosyltransferase family 1 protein [Beijerinckiaceae bacterium]|nr:MAG: glycosyltransferase family 1 protein [Beijerinckiaceae bacterium]